jgi:predicted lipid-binding transport protein (Tim44 family)
VLPLGASLGVPVNRLIEPLMIEKAKMKIFLTLMIALTTVSVLMIQDAEARRLGGGGSFGRQMTIPRQAPKAVPAQARPQGASPTPAAGGAGRWLGPLAGLAAGGLLASLFFGGAFDGMAPMDWLLIGGLAIGGFLLLRAMRRRSSAPMPVTSAGRVAPGFGALGGMGQTEADTPPVATGQGSAEAPSWFDGSAFAEGAKTHFIRLQAAWDQADWRDIRTYTTPEMFAELQREHGRSATPGQYTEVVTLNAELLQVQRDSDLVVASIRFSGLVREESDGPAQPFDEIWNVQHPWATPEGDWLIAGIQQSNG